ncbi:hypothetical protein [Nitrolancea hollandica]|uniref:Uncharacterized protein n=1 Tax=Nitrolancea hollandica Lb TaxID=1129897 RepID=I4EM16_9BACT|nr:hypothetical protein [Nitrolancea hollandica]CCF85729.1 conserved hypothetical protein [Nitrolancea hollandica Lb]
MNVVGPAIVTPIIAIVFVAAMLIGTGEVLLWLAKDFSHTISIAFATGLMFAYTLVAWAFARGK